jgi:hypothetical protein
MSPRVTRARDRTAAGSAERRARRSRSIAAERSTPTHAAPRPAWWVASARAMGKKSRPLPQPYSSTGPPRSRASRS